LNRQGVAGVVEKSRPSRPTQLTSGLRLELLANLQCSPEQHGLPRAAWDGATLAVLLRRRYGVSLKIRQAQNLLHRLGYRLTRVGYPYLQAKAEDAEKFRRRLNKLRHLGPRDVLVFEDKTGFSKHPRLSRLWTPNEHRHRQRLNVFGWVAPLLGRHGMMHLAKGNTRAFLALLRRLRHSLRGKTIHLYVDRAP
jgi:transposase